MSTPYIVGLTIKDADSVVLNNVNVTVRVESTNESKTKTTNSSGEVNFNLGSTTEFPSGWQVGDIFSYVVLYQGYEAYGSHTITSGEGGFTLTVTLTAVATAPSLRYFTAKEYLDYFDLKIIEDDAENGINLQRLVKVGRSVEAEIDSDCGTKFDSGNSFTEHIDTHEFRTVYHISYSPVLTVTTAATTQNDEDTTPDYTNNTTEWDTMTEGTDYSLDKSTGSISISPGTKSPITRRWGLYIAGTYGRSSVPADVKELAIVLTGSRMMGAAFLKARMNDKSDAKMSDMSWVENLRKRVIARYGTDLTLMTT